MVTGPVLLDITNYDDSGMAVLIVVMYCNIKEVEREDIAS
jgi:hypothetical protein